MQVSVSWLAAVLYLPATQSAQTAGSPVELSHEPAAHGAQALAFTKSPVNWETSDFTAPGGEVLPLEHLMVDTKWLVSIDVKTEAGIAAAVNLPYANASSCGQLDHPQRTYGAGATVHTRVPNLAFARGGRTRFRGRSTVCGARIAGCTSGGISQAVFVCATDRTDVFRFALIVSLVPAWWAKAAAVVAVFCDSPKAGVTVACLR